MRIPLIKIIDKSSGYTHRIGSNVHDVLCVHPKDGTISYSNLQNCCGSKKLDFRHNPEYRFYSVSAPIDEDEQIIEFVSVWEFAKIIITEWLDELDSRRKLKKYIKNRKRRNRK